MAGQSRPLRDKLRQRLHQFFQHLKIQRWLNSFSKVRRLKSKNMHRNREYGLQFMKSLTDENFQRIFRVSRGSFQKLCDGIALRCSVDILQAKRSSGSYISITARLAATLRWLGGGSYLDICGLFGIDMKNFFNVKHGPLWRTVAILDESLQLGFSLQRDTLMHTAKEFAQFSHGRMTGCVMAVDGWVCATRQPTVKEVGINIKSYRNRKSCWGIVVLAGCDARCRFTLFSSQCSGSTNDIMAWEMYSLKTLLDDGLLPPQYYFIGDEAFTNTAQFLSPHGGTGIGDWKDSFNYHLSAMRQCIERAFGILTKRWGIFWRPLACRFDKWSTICTVAAKLHNFCIDEGAPVFPRYDPDIHEGDE